MSENSLRYNFRRQGAFEGVQVEAFGSAGKGYLRFNISYESALIEGDDLDHLQHMLDHAKAQRTAKGRGAE